MIKCWWRMLTISGTSGGMSSSSRMSLLCILWLVTVSLTPGCEGQRLREAEGDQAVGRAQLEETDAVCHQDGCYAVFLQKRSFREAGRSCRERGGTLATMHTVEAAGVVHKMLMAVDTQGSRLRLRLWIGLHRPPRQCSTTRPLRGYVWVTGDQDGKFTNWLREETPGTCAAPRCVAMTFHTSETARDHKENLRWIDGSCAVPLDGYICQYGYKGMCPPLGDEGRSPAVYTTPFHLVSTILTHVPYGSVAALDCPADVSNPNAVTEQTVLCMERDDNTVGWSRESPLCSSNPAPQHQDWCSGDHGCEQYCQNTDTDYYCYCSEGFTIDEDGYSCRPDPLTQTEPLQLSSDAASPTEEPQMKEVCVVMGCEYNCVETLRGPRCTCPPGYQMAPDGRRCSDVDECHQKPCSQDCFNIPGTFHCTCFPGYQPDDEGECVDVDECLDEGSCEGSCENTMGSFTCLCSPGYELGSGGECVDVDECVGDSPCGQQCLNFMGGYQCYCDNGFDLQSDGLTCVPSPDDEEYSTLTPDPSDSSLVEDLDPSIDTPWSTSFTPDPEFEPDTNIEVDWLTEAPHEVSPDMPHGSDNDLNKWDALSPVHYHTTPSPGQKHSTGNEIDHQAGAKTRGEEVRVIVAGNNPHESDAGTGEAEEPKINSVEDAQGIEDRSSDGKPKQDKSWLLVALLVPLCVFLVVMLALGIVYCTSCAVDKSLSFTDCYRWVLPTTPPDTRNGKAQA
ncbi:endosialin-like [Gouania willdenowi]|uniref:CD248 n=1 Tax=Gouania willdenowi TaxID=441366 RepID=A0A8C5G442_GOUWI|nr:endosialin [Gouania willdenowi]